MQRKAFEAELASLGFDEVVTREWPPNHFEATHSSGVGACADRHG